MDGGSSDTDGVSEDSVEGEEVSTADKANENSVGGEDMGGGELPWARCWEKKLSSTAVSSAANAVLIE